MNIENCAPLSSYPPPPSPATRALPSSPRFSGGGCISFRNYTNSGSKFRRRSNLLTSRHGLSVSTPGSSYSLPNAQCRVDSVSRGMSAETVQQHRSPTFRGRVTRVSPKGVPSLRPDDRFRRIRMLRSGQHFAKFVQNPVQRRLRSRIDPRYSRAFDSKGVKAACQADELTTDPDRSGCYSCQTSPSSQRNVRRHTVSCGLGCQT